MLCFADINFNILRFVAFTDNHAGVNFHAGSDKQRTAVLRIEQAIGNGRTAFEGDQAAQTAVGKFTLERTIAGKFGIDDTGTLGIGHEFISETDQTAGGDIKLKAGGTCTDRLHADQRTLAVGKLLNNSAGVFIRNINVSFLHRLQFFAVLIIPEDNLGLADSEFISLAAHGFNQDGQMQFAAAGNLESIRVLRIFYPEADIGIELTVQTIADMAGCNVFTFTAGQRRVIYDEIHRDGRLGNFLERDWIRIIDGAYGIADMQILNTGQSNDGTDGCALHFRFFQAVKLIQLADADLLEFVRIMMINHHSVLIDGDGAAGDFSDTDTANIFIIVDGADQNLQRTIFITLRSRNVINNRIEQRLHIFLLIGKTAHGITVAGGSKDERAVKLLVAGVQVHEQLQNLIHHLLRAGFRAVALVDAHDNRKAQVQGFLCNKLCLRHRAFESIDHQNDTVHHLQNTLYLTAEISMSGGVNNIDFCVFVSNGCVFGQDGNTPLTLQSV